MRTAACVMLLVGCACGQTLTAKNGRHFMNEMDKIVSDESHCLNGPEIRGDKDSSISCYCRDAIAEARYVYFNYLLNFKDTNFFFIEPSLEENASNLCGKGFDVLKAISTKGWRWNGPEVVRTYPSDDVVERISPEMKDGKPYARWVPFTVQLVFRDSQGRVTRTENYATRELEPIVPKD